MFTKCQPMNRSADVAVVGAGIVGLAHAYMALRKGYKVVLFDRDEWAVGASIRNFGLVWPVGQEPGTGFTYALRSRQHWTELAAAAGFWINPSGSLHLAYHADEEALLQEFLELYKYSDYQVSWFSGEQAVEKSGVINPDGLRGALWSATECTVNPRQAIRKIPEYLAEKFGLITRWGHVVKGIALPVIETASEQWQVQKVFVCSGADFETLYPDHFKRQDLTKCKLQMMKAVPRQPVVLGPALCAGLTLRHYAAFAGCPSLKLLDARYDKESSFWKENGIHVLLSQNDQGELIIGDSHHYARTHDPFLSEAVDQRILAYLNSFVKLDFQVTERWHGVYPKMAGHLSFVQEVEEDVVIVNALGGAGMTLSFGLAEENLERF